jgi:cytoplasmic iron level regulating protein YaaA (DUF328/UPF0246 family)
LKVLISPSKTMVPCRLIKPYREPSMLEHSKNILVFLRSMNIDAFKQYFDVTEKVAQQIETRLASFELDHTAIFAYMGAQYKAISPYVLSKEQLQHLDNTIVIVSGLFGLVKPLDTIALYRMPMAKTIDNVSLSTYWHDLFIEELKNETIINLCSNEYSQAIEKMGQKLINISFWEFPEKQFKISSMKVKQLRGKMSHYIATQLITSEQEIKNFCEDNFIFSEEDSTDSSYVFVYRG